MITSGFFDSVNSDRLYNAEQMSSYFDGIVSNGVYEMIGDRFLVSENSGLTVNVGTGRAIINCHWIKNDTVSTLSISPADVQYGRVDAIVLRLDLSERMISLTVKNGTPSASPLMPEITRNDTVYELYLATVYVAKNATQVTAAEITDLRPSVYCGWVTGVIKQVDTSDLFLQWQAAYEKQFATFDAYMNAKMQEFNSWFAALTKQLTVQTGVTKYEYRQTLGPGSNTATVDIDEYDMNADVLLVFVDGVYYSEGYDYEIKPPVRVWAYPLVRFNQKFNKSTKITMVVLKNVIGQNVITANAGNLVIQSSGVVGEAGSMSEPEEVQS